MFEVIASTGFNKEILGGKSIREVLKDKIIRLYSGTIPTASGVYTAADAAETGTRIVPITTAGATAKVKQKITITPVVGDASADVWSVTLNGITVSVTDDGTPSVAEVCTLLSNALKAINGTAITTPPCDLSIPDVEGLFTITDNTTNVTVEAATAGVSFEYSSTVTGATTASLTSVLTTDNAYGIRFEPYSGITVSTLERKSGDTWKGIAASTAVITHGRFLADDDAGGLSDSLVRLQGDAAVANAFFILTHTDVTVGEEISVTLAELGYE